MKFEVAKWSKRAAILLLVAPVVLFATTYTSSQDGNWNVSATWGGSGVPVAGDSAIIGNAVTLTAAAAAQYVQVNSSSSLVIVTYTMTIADSIVGAGTTTISTGTLDVGGNISVNTITCSGASNINLEGDWDVSSFTRSTSDITIDGTGAQSFDPSAGSRFNDITVNKTSGILTLNSNFFIYSIFSLSSGSVDIPSGRLVSFRGSDTVMTVSGGNFSTSSSGQLYFDNTSVIKSSVSSTNLPGLSLTRNSDITVTLFASDGAVTFTVRGDVERGGEVLVALSLSPNATLAYASGTTLIYSATNVAMTVGSEWPGTSSPENVWNESSVNITLSDDRTIPSGGTLTLEQTGGNFIVDTGNTLTINGTLERKTTGTAGITVNGSLTYGSTDSWLKYNASSAVTIGAEWPTGTSGIPENVEITITTGALSGSNSYNIPKDLNFNVGNLNLSSNNLAVLGNVVSSDVAGSTTINDATTLIIGNSGTGTSYSQTIQGSLTLNNLTINKTGGSHPDSNTVSLTGTGALSFTNNSTLTITAGTLNLNGLTVNAVGASNTIVVNDSLRTGGTSIAAFETITATSGTVIFDGSSQENIPVEDYGALIINNAGGGLIGAGLTTVGTSLTLTNGIVTTASTDILRINSGATVSAGSAASFVLGPLDRVISDNTAYSFPIGSSGRFRPSVFDYNSFAGGTNEVLRMQYVPTNPGGTPPAGTSTVSSYGHYTLQSVGGTAPTSVTHSLTLRYTGTAFTPYTRNRILVQNNTGPTYTLPASQSQSSDPDNVTATNISALPTNGFILAFGSAGATIVWDGGSAANNNWSTADNWVGDAAPQTGDVVDFTGSYGAGTNVAVYDGSVTQSQFASIDLSPISGTISLTLTKTALDLTDDNTSLTVGNNATLIYNGTNLQMDAGAYDSSRTDIPNGSTVQYNTGSVHTDIFDDLVISGATTTTGSGSVQVKGNLTKSGSAAFSTSISVVVEGNYTNTLGNATYSTGGLTVNGSNFTLTSGVVGGSPTINSSTITVNGGSFGGTVTFSNGNAQTMSGVEASFASLTINKSANNLTISTNGASVSGTLTLTDGLIVLSDSVLTLGSGAMVSGGSESSYVRGPVANEAATGTNSFPIGASYYRPVSTNSITGASPRIKFEVVDTAPNNSFDDPPIIGISEVRRWIGTITSGSITGGQVTLNYGADDGVQEFNNDGDVVVVRSSDNSADAYSSLGGQSSGSAPTGSVTSTSGVGTSLDYFTLGTTTGDNSLPVDLLAFEAKPEFGRVTLSWTTASELNNLGFNILRKGVEETSWNQINESLIEGAGTVSHESDYVFVDGRVIGGITYVYVLESVATDGSRSEDKRIEVVVPVPDNFVLFNNYPNPFNPVTHIKFQLPENAVVKLVIYNTQGERVRTLVAGREYAVGEHVLRWDAADDLGAKVSSGMYIYRFEAGSFSKTGKMVLLK